MVQCTMRIFEITLRLGTLGIFMPKGFVSTLYMAGNPLESPG